MTHSYTLPAHISPDNVARVTAEKGREHAPENTANTAKQNLRVWLKVLKTTRHIEALVREKLRDEFDTTLPRFDVLSALFRFEDGLRMTELSSALRVSNGNVTGIVDRLVENGCVIRTVVTSDKRATLARLTPKGRAEFSRMAIVHERWIDEIMQVVSPAQAGQLLTIMDTIDHACGVGDNHAINE